MSYISLFFRKKYFFEKIVSSPSPSLFEFGALATPAMEKLGEDGNTFWVEQDMKRHSPKIRRVVVI